MSENPENSEEPNSRKESQRIFEIKPKNPQKILKKSPKNPVSR